LVWINDLNNIDELSKNKSNCKNTGVDDLDLSKCLLRLNVSIGDSRDQLGRERFHPNNFHKEFYGPVDNSEFPFHKQSTGKQCCSLDWISFHDKNHLNFINMINKVNGLINWIFKK
jgi:glycoprotein-N-acetylgalactosamine 3-beta-galactosyltransferase